MALVDRDLYLPSWTDDRMRCQTAGIPGEVTFKTKPQLAPQAMVEWARRRRAIGWVTGDTIYGGGRRLRMWLSHAIRHVMAVKCTEPVGR